MRTVGGVFLSAVAALAIAAVPATAAPKPQVITFVSYQTNIHDAGTNTVVINDKDIQGKKQIGHDVFTCKVNGPKVTGCVAVFSLAKGTMSVKSGAGSATDTSKWKPIITGGTRAFSGAHGTAAYKTLNQAKGTVQITLMLK